MTSKRNNLDKVEFIRLFKHAYSFVSFEFSLKSIIASYLFRWINKVKNSVSHIADDVKCRLLRIAHSNNINELHAALDDLRNWEFFQGKLKAWIEGLLRLTILFFKSS